MSEILVIEGAMGLFDGPATGADSAGDLPAGSTAQVAHALDLPIVVVIDGARMGQTAGAIVKGLAVWNPDLGVAGVIINPRGATTRCRT